MADDRETAYTTLLDYVREHRGFDLAGAGGGGLRRRIDERLAAVGAPDYRAYRAVLEDDDGEFAALFDAVLVAASSLRRDPEAWEALESEVIPRIVEAKGDGEPIRVWSAGCASGEEAYSLAVLLAEAVGDDRFRRDVTVYATDADRQALARARPARYVHQDLLSAFGEERTRRFFEPLGHESMFRQDLRRSLVFGHHDLARDPPMSHIDLVVCRNTLVYLPAEVQEQVLAGLHGALTVGGYLFLGAHETLAERTVLFDVVDARRQLFRRAGPGPDHRVGAALVHTAFDEDPVAKVIVDRDGTVVATNRRAWELFGRPAVAPGAALAVHLGPSLWEAVRGHRAEAGLVPDRPADGGPRRLEVFATPVGDPAGPGPVGSLLSFVELRP